MLFDVVPEQQQQQQQQQQHKYIFRQAYAVHGSRSAFTRPTYLVQYLLGSWQGLNDGSEFDADHYAGLDVATNATATAAASTASCNSPAATERVVRLAQQTEAQKSGNIDLTTGVIAGPTAAMDSALTILIANAPTPNDPDLSMVQSALGSVIDNAPGTIAVPKVFAFDGMPDDLLAERKTTYQAKIRAIEKHIADNVDNVESMWYNARTCEKPTNGRLSGLLNYSLVECVTTPLVFIQQHDLELAKPVNMAGLVRTFDENPGVNAVFFHYSTNNLSQHGPSLCMANHTTKTTSFKHQQGCDKNGGCFCWFSDATHFKGHAHVPLTQIVGFSDRTHITRVSWYLDHALTQPLGGFDGRFHGFVEWAFVLEQRRTLAAEMVDLNPSMSWPKQFFCKYGTFLYGSVGDGAYHKHNNGRCLKLANGTQVCDNHGTA